MRLNIPGIVIISVVCLSFALAQRGYRDAENRRKEIDWNVNDLPQQNGIIIPISNEVILRNSYDLLKEHPDDRQLKYQTLNLAKILAKPKAPSHIAWEILIKEGVLKDGMSIKEAQTILGPPTDKRNNQVIWYYNFWDFHVFTGLKANLEDGVLKNWEVYKG